MRSLCFECRDFLCKQILCESINDYYFRKFIFHSDDREVLLVGHVPPIRKHWFYPLKLSGYHMYHLF
jgi:hypothetical protein